MKVMIVEMRGYAWGLAQDLDQAEDQDEYSEIIEEIKQQSSLNADAILAARFFFPANGL